MTPDVEQIRAALAACNGKPWAHYYASPEDRHLVANAPVWLAWCVTEIEQLRGQVTYLGGHLQAGAYQEKDLMGDLATALEEIERLTAEHKFESCITEINELRAECERLRAELDNYDEEQRIQREKDDR